MASGLLGSFWSFSPRLVSPTVEPPKRKAEEDCAATIYTARVTKFVSQPGVILRVNGDIAPHQEVRH